MEMTPQSLTNPAPKQMSIIPAVLTIQLQDEETANQLINNTKLFGKKVSFGTSDSRLEIPAKMSHATNSKDSLASKGIDNATVRISVGLENTEDLIEDLARINVEVEYASEFRYRNPIINEGDVIIAISQSGETADTMVALENAKHGLCFSSGMGATDAVVKLLRPGDEVITGNDLYGGTYRMFTKVFANYGIKFHFIDLNDANNISNYINENTKLIWVETPTNPTMQIIDIALCASIAKKHNITLAVDNTFASPYLQNPLDLGADIVMHSATKYLSGHSDVIQGCLIMNDVELKIGRAHV